MFQRGVLSPAHPHEACPTSGLGVGGGRKSLPRVRQRDAYRPLWNLSRVYSRSRTLGLCERSGPSGHGLSPTDDVHGKAVCARAAQVDHASGSEVQSPSGLEVALEEPAV